MASTMRSEFLAKITLLHVSMQGGTPQGVCTSINVLRLLWCKETARERGSRASESPKRS
jgi:hypothetical protein